MGEETTDGEGIQAAGHDRFQEKGWPWQATEQGESGRKLRKPVQGCGQAWGRNPVPTEGRLKEFLMESINTMALLSPATFLNENQFINTMSTFPLPQGPDLGQATKHHALGK